MDEPEDLGARRRVFVLGPDPSLDIDLLFSAAAEESSPVLFLSVGYPVTPTQQRLVATATEKALDLAVRFDAVLVAGSAGVAEHLREGDRISVLASGRERRRLEAAIRSKG